MADVDLIVRDDGTRVLAVKRGWTQPVLDAIRTRKFDELSVSMGKWPDFRPLVPYRHRIRALCVSAPVDSFEGIDSLTELTRLELDATPKAPIDLSRLKKLRSCYLAWMKGYPPKFFSLPRLVDLTLVRYGGTDLEEVCESGRLRSLDIRQGAVRSTRGLEKLEDLQRLSLLLLRNLEGVESWDALRNLAELRIEDCPKLTRLDGIDRLSNLEALILDCGAKELASTEWLARCRRLAKVVIAVPVREIDWNGFFSLDRLTRISIQSAKGYSLSDEEILSVAQERRRAVKAFKRFQSRGAPAFFVELAPRREIGRDRGGAMRRVVSGSLR